MTILLPGFRVVLSHENRLHNMISFSDTQPPPRPWVPAARSAELCDAGYSTIGEPSGDGLSGQLGGHRLGQIAHPLQPELAEEEGRKEISEGPEPTGDEDLVAEEHRDHRGQGC